MIARLMIPLTLNGFRFRLAITVAAHGDFFFPQHRQDGDTIHFNGRGVNGSLVLRANVQSPDGAIDYQMSFTSPFQTRVRLLLSLDDENDLFHLIPGNIFGDNNAPHVRPNEFPVLATDRIAERNRAPLWEFRADRASHPVSMVCCARGAVGLSIDPYSDCAEADDGFIRNGVLAALPNVCGVSLGYGNAPMTFHNKTVFTPATADLHHGATARGTIFGIAGDRRSAHTIIRRLHESHRDVPVFSKSYTEALRGLAESFAEVNYSPELGQYTNRKCAVPPDTRLEPWRAIVEIGWTGGAMLAYPFALAEQLLGDFRFPKPPAVMLDQICSGYNPATGLIRDTCVNRFTKSIPPGWNESDINGWWSGERVPLTRDNHCAYTNAHAAYYLLSTVKVAQTFLSVSPTMIATWQSTALNVLQTAIDLQRDDGAFGYIFSGKEKKVLDYDGFAGCWFTAALPLAWKLTGDPRYLQAAERSIGYYHAFVRDLFAWGTPMDTCKSIDSEGNLAFIRAARLMHEFTSDAKYLDMLLDGAHYEYLWRYGFRARPQAPPLKESNWNSCGGSITSVSNPHVHPMSVVATADLEYLARITGDDYHQQRADDGMAWLLNTMELYPAITGYGRYGVLSERTCPSDGLLEERFRDDNCPSSTWWSYNAWASGSAMEAIAEQLRHNRPEPRIDRTGHSR